MRKGHNYKHKLECYLGQDIMDLVEQYKIDNHIEYTSHAARDILTHYLQHLYPMDQIPLDNVSEKMVSLDHAEKIPATIPNERCG